MQSTDLLSIIDSEIESSRASVAADTIKFINIKSVQGEPLPSAPFGIGPKRMLDEFLEMAENDGFFVKDYGVGVASASLKDGEPDLGIWLHGDVVPEGDGWDFDPYNAVEYKGCIIGRGATDNKGQLAAAYNLLKIFKKLGIELKYNPAIYLGSNEESGMKDLSGVEGNPDAKGFINLYTPPRLSLVPDSSFPVGYGGKGSMNISIRSKSALTSLSFTAGEDASPGLATARFFDSVSLSGASDKCSISEDGREVSAFTPPRHAARPDPDGNMITNLTSFLIDSADICDSDKKILSVLRDISLDINGKGIGIATEHEILGNLTVFSKQAISKDGKIELFLNIRYPIGITYEQICKKVSKFAEENGFETASASLSTNPYLMNKDSEIVRMLFEVASSITGDPKQPYTLSGATYAHKLPNAYAFGGSGNCPPDDFKPGRGGAHKIDESVSLDRLLRMMRIYARALIRLNNITF